MNEMTAKVVICCLHDNDVICKSGTSSCISSPALISFSPLNKLIYDSLILFTKCKSPVL